MISQDVRLHDGRTVRVYDTGPGAVDTLTVLWHHGSPQTGAPLAPLLTAAAKRHIRLISYGRPSYGGSSPNLGRNVASAAADVAQITDSLGVSRLAVMGASGGGPHALACAALLPDRVTAVVCLAGIAPLTEDFDWFDGMASADALLAAIVGRDERERYAAVEEFDPNSFVEADWTALAGPWSSLGDDVGVANEAGPDGLIDDDVALASPWGFDPAEIAVPVLLVQGGKDHVVPPAHADWLLRRCADAELWLRPNDGHVSVLNACPVAMDWLSENSNR
jgi:pimeloyl-ACP methyl ester carboxylesterase